MYLQGRSLFALALALAVGLAWPVLAESASERHNPLRDGDIELPVRAGQLGDALRDISRRSGVSFRLAEGLERDEVAKNATGSAWPEVIRSLLEGYNYAVESGRGGAWKRVTISGRSGDGKQADGGRENSAGRFLTYGPAAVSRLPLSLRGLKPGSVFPVTLPLAALKGMKKGQAISLQLPAGRQGFVHDNRFKHGNGNLTWSGFLEGREANYRAMVTMGKFGPMGHIITPDGTYQIFAEDGQTYLVDVDGAGLQPGSLLEDQATPLPEADHATPGNPGSTVHWGGRSQGVAPSSQGPAAASSIASRTAKPGESAGDPEVTVIDLLVLYTRGLTHPDGRIDYLSDVTNQAFLDSGINAQIRVVHRQPVDYTESNDNAQVLDDLTAGNRPFGKVAALRKKYGADLITLIRPFHASSQHGCGIAWVNGGNGAGLSPALGYSVVSDGTDQDGELVHCGPQVLAHELGHNLGTVHDRSFTKVSGAFSYSYAWGAEGVFGTIMSYHRPGVLLFSTPALGNACFGHPCGYAEGEPNASDNARTINETAPIVSGFEPTVIDDRSGR